jgi:hypothetical protein
LSTPRPSSTSYLLYIPHLRVCSAFLYVYSNYEHMATLGMKKITHEKSHTGASCPQLSIGIVFPLEQ